MMRVISPYIILMLLPILLGSSCSDDLRKASLRDPGSGQVAISFSVDKSLTVRSENVDSWESKIDHAYLLFYAEDGSCPLAYTKAEVKEDTPGQLYFKLPSRLKEETDYRLVAVANADFFKPEGFVSFGSYIENLMLKSPDGGSHDLLLYFKDRISPESVPLLPMFGQTSDGSSFRFSLNNGTYSLDVSLKFRRSVARVDVTNLSTADFTIEGIALCNWRDAVNIYSDRVVAGSIQGMLVDDDLQEENFISVADEDGIQSLKGKLYCFPSVTEDSQPGDTSSTALIIKGKYGNDTESTFYRVNIGASGRRAEVNGNIKYLITIRSVKGSGSSTAKEAYSSSESLISLSVVEDWDLEGNYDMDDYGNFIVCSRGMLEFEGNETGYKEIKLLTSKGLDWKLEYIPDNEASKDAFEIKKSDNGSILVKPESTNQNVCILSGICRVTAPVREGNPLKVDIRLLQNPAGDLPFVPFIPDQDLALVPLTDKGVKVDHEKRLIEIDGFAPEIFNSFIDIPFMLHVSDNVGKDRRAIVYNKSDNALQWPLEGRISQDPAKDYYYNQNSFLSNNVYSSTLKDNVEDLKNEDLTLSDQEKFYISVGAMAPDDPEIVRSVRVKCADSYLNVEEVEYTLVIKPRPVIIDDVVMINEDGRCFVVMDRNLQDLSNYKSFIGRNEVGQKEQAYHYSKLRFLSIPLKYTTAKGSKMTEDYHGEFAGFSFSIGFADMVINQTSHNNSKNNWLAKYVYKDGVERTSPFYESDNYLNWTCPGKEMWDLCRTKIKVSKMRMFLVSEIPALIGNDEIPICCYVHYNCEDSEFKNSAFPYLAMEDGNNGNTAVGFYVSHDEVKERPFTSGNVVVRLVRTITQEELENYKENYLGYGSRESNLSPCHEDTYTRPRFIPVN